MGMRERIKEDDETQQKNKGELSAKEERGYIFLKGKLLFSKTKGKNMRYLYRHHHRRHHHRYHHHDY